MISHDLSESSVEATTLKVLPCLTSLISKEEIINLFKDKIYRYNELNPNEFIIQNKNKDIIFHKNLVNKYQNAFYIKQKAYYSITQSWIPLLYLK